MEPDRDFKELLERFNACGIEYLIVGGYALAVHGAPRFTQDLDVYVRPSRENAERIIALLAEIGFARSRVSRPFLPILGVLRHSNWSGSTKPSTGETRS
ncbi:MAG: hypothetical protein AAB368_13940 [bacterium]